MVLAACGGVVTAKRCNPICQFSFTSHSFQGARRLRQCPKASPAARSARARPIESAILERFFSAERFFADETEKRDKAKETLLATIRPLKRGLIATDEEKRRVEELARALENMNPIRKPLASPYINGRWLLLYTTSDSILGKNRPWLFQPDGRIYQILDTKSLRAANIETFPLFNQVYADLKPETDSRVIVRFRWFKIFGLIPVPAPPSARGKLDTTYLDQENLRISRGDKGNLFILEMVDPNERL
eukprot:jgi/Botrbrau1/20949/Bobra.0135s0068.1